MSYRDRPVGVTILAIIHIVFATVYGMLWLIALPSYRYANPSSLFFTTPFFNNSLTGGVVLSIAINLLIIFYLTRPKVQKACNGQISSVLELITLLGLLKQRKPKTASLDLQMRLWNWKNFANQSKRKSDR